MPYQLDPAAALRLGQAVLQQEAEALHMIADRIGDDFVEAVPTFGKNHTFAA